MLSKMGEEESAQTWSCFAKFYDPLKIGSIDGTDTEPHDKGIIRASNWDYKPNKHVKGKPGCTIFVSRLSPKTTKDTIKDIFSRFGRLKRFRLVKDIVTGFPKGYAFIEYETESAAEEAYRKAYKMNVDGHTIFIDFECERLLKGWKPRRLGGGFGGRKESGQLRFGCRDRPFRKPISLEIKEHEDRLKRDKELRSARELEREERRRRDRDCDRKRSPEGAAGGKRKRSRSADRDRKRGRSRERRSSNTDKKLDDSHSSKASKSETNSERGSKERISKGSEGVDKRKRSRSGDRNRRSHERGSKEKISRSSEGVDKRKRSRSDDRSRRSKERGSKEKASRSSEGVDKRKRSRSGDRSRRSNRSKDRRMNTEKKSAVVNDENHQEKAIKFEAKENLELLENTKSKDEPGGENKLENTSSSS